MINTSARQQLQTLGSQIQQVEATVRKDLQQRLDEATRGFRESGGAIIQRAALALFEQFPELESFGWEQSVEYDDERHQFRVQWDYPGINGIEGYELEDASYEVRNGNQAEHAVLVPVFHAVRDFLQDIETTTYERLFGLGARVEITRDGVTIETFETEEPDRDDRW